jgi:hypothetical protein
MVKKSCFSFFSRKALTGFEPQANLGRIRTPVLPVALKSSTLSTSPTIVFQPPRNTVRYIWLKKVVSAFFSKGLGRIRTPGLPVALKSSTLSTSPTIVFRSPKNTVRYMVKKNFYAFFFKRPRPDSNPRPACRIKVEHSINVANDCFSIAEKYRTIHGKKTFLGFFFQKASAGFEPQACLSH